MNILISLMQFSLMQAILMYRHVGLYFTEHKFQTIRQCCASLC